MDAFITYSDVICPLGKNLEIVFENVLKKKTGIRKDEVNGYIASFTEDNQEDIFGAQFSVKHPAASTMLLVLLKRFIEQCNVNLQNEDTLLIICSTKGDIEELPDISISPLLSLSQKAIQQFSPANTPVIISNACISGLHGLIHAQRLIASGRYKKVVVAAVDSVSSFVLNGFSSLSAISESSCKPFDATRTGLNLGEGVAIALLESQASGPFPVQVIKGAISNDANHITGPARDGRGLFAALQKILPENKETITADNTFISPHGTATIYNDEMESLAFTNANLSALPMIAYKGYFGHTLGASGLLETVIGIESLRNGNIPVSYGYENNGVSKPLNITKESEAVRSNDDLKYFIKTGSGFGGCNAAIMFSK